MPTHRISARVRGFTLIEMLVAVAITLIIMGAVVTLFASVNRGISQSIGSLDVQDQIRSARNLLVHDLANLTANPAAPPFSMRAGQGYFEIIEGEQHDYSSAADSWVGDPDDAMCFTINGRDFPSSNLPGQPGEPTAAEVIWFTNKDDGRSTWTLYRRVLPILPGHPAEGTTFDQDEDEFFGQNGYNVSRYTRSVSGGTGYEGVFVTLSDLGKNSNRHGRLGDHRHSKAAVLANLRTASPTGGDDDFDHLADVAVLENVVGFDVRVWDPGAPLVEIATTVPGTTTAGRQIVIQPGDVNFSIDPVNIVGYGAFVDLGYIYARPSVTPLPEAPFSSGAGGGTTYSTWTRVYDGLGRVSDGLDSMAADGSAPNGNGIVDDPGERTNRPTHLTPLKAVQVTIRVFDPKSQTIREVTIRQPFTR